MATPPGRVAFQRCLVHEHRNPNSAISALALDAAGTKLYLGFTDGQLEEYKITISFAQAKALLSARKHVGKKPIAAVRHLPGAQCLAVLCDGALLLLHVDTLDGTRATGVSGVTAMTGEGSPTTLPPTLALASKPNKKSVRITLLEVFASNSGQGLKHTTLVQKHIDLPEQGSVVALTWVGKKLIAATGMRYLLVDPVTHIFGSICEFHEDDLTPVMLQPLPASQQAVLLMNEVGVITDAHGMPVGSALTFPSPPLALAHAGLFVLAVCDDGVHVFDKTTSEWVQHLDFGQHLQPAPGQAVRTAGNTKGNVVAMSGYRTVWLLLPVALEDQAKQLLQRRKYTQALELLQTCGSGGGGGGSGGGVPQWTLVGMAQTALLLMQELRFMEASQVLMKVPPSSFQPKNFLPMFPHYTARWLRTTSSSSLTSSSGGGGGGGGNGRTPPPRSPSGPVLLWGLARPLTDVTAAVHATLLARSRARQGADGVDITLLTHQVEQHCEAAAAAVADYLWHVFSLGAHTLEQADHTLEQADHTLEQADAVHTLLCLLLHQLDDGMRIETLAGQLNHVVLEDVRGAFVGVWGGKGGAGGSREVGVFTGGKTSVPNTAGATASSAHNQGSPHGGGRYMAWALLCAQREGYAAEALDTWRALVEGRVEERGVGTAQHATMLAACATHAASLLTTPTPNTPIPSPQQQQHLALHHLPWLLAAAPLQAVQVAVGVPGLHTEDVLKLTRGRYPIPQLLLLQHVVETEGSQEASYHTELALTAVQLCLAAAQGTLQPPPTHTTPTTTPAATPDTPTPPTPAPTVPHIPPNSKGPPPKSRGGPATLDVSPGALRGALQRHLEASDLYDVQGVLAAVRGSVLAEEQVMLYRKLGQHTAALRILALQLDDMHAAERYCRQHAGQEGYAALMEMLLAPGDEGGPRIQQACRLLNAREAMLDPLCVLGALPDNMALSLAVGPVACMLRERTHRKREGMIVRNVQRTMNLEVAAQRAEIMSERVLLTDERVCHTCHARIGTKMFAIHPTGTIVCFRCYQQHTKPSPPHPGVHQQQQLQR